MARAKLVSKAMKYPGLEDYARSVQEVDMKFYLTLKVTVTELRNHYVRSGHLAVLLAWVRAMSFSCRA